MTPSQRNNLYAELDKALKYMDDEKKQYYAVKEFNSWSQALGWEEFKKHYDELPKKVFEEYIGGSTFVTPTPWVKKLANQYQDKDAANEMFRREMLIGETRRTEEEKAFHQLKMGARKKQEILQWNDEKTKAEF